MKVGTKLQHYKGGKYTVLGKGTHSETLEDMVIYQTIKTKKYGLNHYKCFMKKLNLKVKQYQDLKRFKPYLHP